LRPWGQFLRFSVYCTNIQGSALYDATLGEPQLIEDMYAEAIEEQSSKRKKAKSDNTVHPPRRGYTREVEALTDLSDNIIALRAETGRWKPSSTKFSPRPLFPSEAVQERMRLRSQQRRDQAIEAAKARWTKDNAHQPP
jgi:hypothetical protein